MSCSLFSEVSHYTPNKLDLYVMLSFERSLSFHPSLNREGRWGTTDDFITSFLHFPCSPLPSVTWRTPGLSIPRCCFPTSSSVCLVFFPLSLCLARCEHRQMMRGLFFVCRSIKREVAVRFTCDIYIPSKYSPPLRTRSSSRLHQDSKAF